MDENQVVDTVTGEVLYIGSYEECTDYTDGKCAITYDIRTYHGKPTLPIEKTKELENRFYHILELSKQPEPVYHLNEEIHEFFTCLLEGMSKEKKIKALAKIIICFR